MIRKHRARDGTVTYGVRVNRGAGGHEWVGTFEKLGRVGEEGTAKWAEHQALARRPPATKLTCGQLADRYLADRARTVKGSTLDRSRYALDVFRRDHEHTLAAVLDSSMAERFAAERNWGVDVLTACFNWAEHKGLVDRSPFHGVSRRRTRGRADDEPLTAAEVERLAAAARRAHRHHGQVMAAYVLFAAYTGMRPGELAALEWRDLDFEQGRVRIRRGLYKGRVDTPKRGQKLVSMPPPARDALLGLPRTNELVFPAKRGGRISGSALSSHYWPPIVAAFGQPVTPYDLRHFCGHYLYVVRDLPARVVAAQLGHSSPRKVEELYGHFKVGALDEIDREFGENVRPLRRAQ